MGDLMTDTGKANAQLTEELMLLRQQLAELEAAGATQRRPAEEALRESEARYRTLIEAAEDGITMKDREGRYILANSAFARSVGMSVNEIIGKTALEVLSPETRDEARAVDLRVLQSGESEEGEAYEWTTSGMRHLLTRKVPVRNYGDVIGVVSIVRDITERKRAEEALRKAGEELEMRVAERTSELRALARRLESVREEERTHMAREIHDELGQELTSLKLDLSWLKRRLAEIGDGHERSAVSSQIVSMEGSVDSTIASVRQISTQLRPTVLDDLGLMAALEWQAMDFERRTGIACDVTLPDTEKALGRDQTTALFRICQESLTNVARHARSSRVDVSVKLDNGDLVLTVADNGRGISDGEAVGGGSLGLLGMRERALALGGTLHVVGTSGYGTVVTARIPLSGPASSDNVVERVATRV